MRERCDLCRQFTHSGLTRARGGKARLCSNCLNLYNTGYDSCRTVMQRVIRRVVREIAKALNGDSNDAEHDALFYAQCELQSLLPSKSLRQRVKTLREILLEPTIPGVIHSWNDEVVLQLNAHGRQLMKVYCNALNLPLDSPVRVDLARGEYRGPLFDAAHIFGPQLILGAPLPFENTSLTTLRSRTQHLRRNSGK